MVYRSLDFDADKKIKYQELRVEMARLYRLLPDDCDTLSEEENVKAKRTVKDSKDTITKGRKRVMKKVQKIMEKFHESCNFWNRKC